MNRRTRTTAAALTAAVLAGNALAGDHHRAKHQRHDAPHTHIATGPWQAVAHEAASGEIGHGWQYFHDPVSLHSVVISPEGDYYYGRGQGLRWIASA